MSRPEATGLTIAQVAERLQCSERQVYRLLKSRRLAKTRIGLRGVRIQESALIRFLENGGALGKVSATPRKYERKAG